VATVVVKLLNLALADVALFGEKDWQQLQVIRQVARDLDHPTAIAGVATVREGDGLALSSRNRYLDPAARTSATAISRALRLAQAEVAAGERNAAKLHDAIAAAITAAGGRVDYVGIADPTSLEPLDRVEQPARALVAAFFGPARLIDNVALLP
jgi:pantoate--beta-alanine ligase